MGPQALGWGDAIPLPHAMLLKLSVLIGVRGASQPGKNFPSLLFPRIAAETAVAHWEVLVSHSFSTLENPQEAHARRIPCLVICFPLGKTLEILRGEVCF